MGKVANSHAGPGYQLGEGGELSWCRGPPAGPCECRCCGPPARSLGVAGWSWSWSGILATAQPGLEMEKEISFAALLK